MTQQDAVSRHQVWGTDVMTGACKTCRCTLLVTEARQGEGHLQVGLPRNVVLQGGHGGCC